MPTVRITDIYDLSTQVNKVGLVAIHTPSVDNVKSLWNGLFQNYRFFRFASCDVAMACAQQLPADPLSVGEEAGTIAPQDMFNPVLYKAVSNESFNRLLARLYGLDPVTSTNFGLSSVDEGNVDDTLTATQQFQMYYSLLADTDGWKRSMPQSGLTMRGLYPIVYSLVNTYGNQALSLLGENRAIDVDKVPQLLAIAQEDEYDDGSLTNLASTIRGPSMRMPRLPTFVWGEPPQAPAHPKTYVGAILVPPAKQHKLYYRLRVTWTVEFSELRPLTETMTFDQMANVGRYHYASDYVEQSRAMTAKSEMVDTNGLGLEKVMSSGK